MRTEKLFFEVKNLRYFYISRNILCVKQIIPQYIDRLSRIPVG
jgi:hypothetical protein